MAALPHTKTLLTYLFNTYGGHTKPAPTASLTVGSTSPLELSVRKLALAQSLAAQAQYNSDKSDASTTGDEDDDEDDNKLASQGQHGSPEVSDEDKSKTVIQLLQDDSVDEDDKPDALKSLLSSLLVIPEHDPLDLDPLILSLLHRYREDLHPSATPVPPLPNHGSTTPSSRPSVSRSSSFRRGFNNSTPARPSAPPSLANALSSSVSSTSSRSAPTSPFRSASPSVSLHHTPAQSPWSSPRPTPLALALSANAAEFKFSPGASEFRPGSSSGASARTRSPLPAVNPHQAQANWAFTSSPLGTPKYAHGPSTGAGGSSAVSSPSYFPRHLDAPSLSRQSSMSRRAARLPWADSDDGDGEHDDDVDEASQEPKHDAGVYANGPMWSGSALYDHPPPGANPYAAAPPAPPPGWDSADGDRYQAYEEGHTPTHPGNGMLLPGPAPGEMPSIEFANALAGPSGLGGMGAYSLTPFDHLYSIFATSNVSSTLLEEALVVTGFDIDHAIDYILETQLGPPTHTNPTLHSRPSSPAPGLQPPRASGFGSGSRPMIVSRDSFDGFHAGPAAARWPGPPAAANSRPQTPTGGGPDQGRGVGGRVCRYYLSGSCLYCRFSHDVGKAVCKFWLRGHCLKGDGRCDFLHSIPPIMRADFEQRAQRRAAGSPGPAPYDPDTNRDEGPDLDFPSLGEAPRARRQAARTTVQFDPARTRFAGAVKFGTKPTLPVAPRAPTIAPPVPTRDLLPQARPSKRLPLRAPLLLPTLPTGPALAALYVRYRSSFLELGANRNKCLARAAECFKRGDGAGARHFSREAQDWSRQVAIEGRDSAASIVQERKRVLKEAVLAGDGVLMRSGSIDETPDRKAKALERGNAVCLGVVSQAAVVANSKATRQLTVDERTEVALDLHALHTDEAISFMAETLLALEREQFAGLAFFVIGEQKHSGQGARDQREAASKLRLEQATTEFLNDERWPFAKFGGVLAVDCLR